MKLEGKTAIVTGAGLGIGAGIAQRLFRDGARVVFADIHPENCQNQVDEIDPSGDRTFVVKTDVTDENQVQNMVAETINKFNGIDILVNNAGIFTDSRIEETSLEEWNRVIGINLTAAFLCSRAVLKMMKDKREGKIVNIGSVVSKTQSPNPSAAYAVSKAGIHRFTIQLAVESAPWINVNAVAPGLTDTPLGRLLTEEAWNFAVNERIPLKRAATPDDIANAVSFLVSSEAEYITGEILDVN
ncbi:MAG TPA: SDR family oxidoreductase, partial [Candidatus Marinimicrobia bacterium]|nr:SDR family oxidoreductase [Candidatus Neomarinimicrobiota bacterium]